VFVSYAHIDNDVPVNDVGDGGWVDLLLEKLPLHVARHLGARATFARDREFIRSNQPLTDQVRGTVQASAVLLVVMSPSYLKSSWCNLERREFLDIAKDRVSEGSMFVVRASPVDIQAQPEEFRDLRGLDFYRRVPHSADYHLLGQNNPRDPDLQDRIITLGREIAEQLERLQQRTRPGNVAPPPAASARVFVASATDDMESRENELRNHLTQAGIEVLPSAHSRYPTTNLAAYEAAVCKELASCALFAQVLGRVPGKKLAFAPDKRLPALQFELARRLDIPALQWRERGEVGDVPDAAYRELLEHAQACGIEEFKVTVAERAVRPAPPPPRSKNPEVAVFVSADARDHDLSMEISNALADFGVDCYRMPATGAPAVLRAALENNLRDCDGLVLVYGRTEFYWVQQQLRQARKINSTRTAPLSTLAVFDGPPPNKPEIPVNIKNLVMVDCRKGIDRDVVRKFVTNLRG
jgi:hypothetical protein